jgi:poly(3-hydroxybutyrate) depolymerase
VLTPILLALVLQNPLVAAQQTLTEGFALPDAIRGGRVPFERDALQERLIRGDWTAPTVAADGWTAIRANADGWFEGDALRRGAYLVVRVESPIDRVALLQAQGQGMVAVNGTPLAGNPYAYDYPLLPVRLRRGANTLLFTVPRGRLRARLLPATAPLQLHTGDTTLPDLIAGEREPLWGAVIVLNTQESTAKGLVLEATAGDGTTVRTALPAVPALSLRKVGFHIAPPGALAGKTDALLRLTLRRPGGAPVTAELALRVRQPQQSQRRTFVSAIDDTVQYYAVLPAQKPSKDNTLVLTLHGASVEAQGQIEAYGPKDWATLVGPTNRRPYGFDWEDWGRLDALEVLAQAERRVPHDPERVSLTGHSMGGHGTWSLGALFPNRFATIAPSAGWISFMSYAGANLPTGEDPMAALFRRAASPSDTLAFRENLRQASIFVLHGDADDNVPVTEARAMREQLATMHHPAVAWHEEPGAGHWWDNDPAPGAACVDYPGIFALIGRSRRAGVDAPDAALVTANPAVSARNGWLTIEQQERSLELSSAQLHWDRASRSVRGETRNVRRLRLDRPELAWIELDGQRIALAGSGPVFLERDAGRWHRARAGAPSSEKNPRRSGPFKLAFGNRMVLVYGTKGTAQENTWAQNKARFDAQTFWYRGNGSPEVLPDTDYDARAMHGRSVILYGNADTNGLWRSLLADSPIVVRRDSVTVNGKSVASAELACLFLRPKPGSETALVGVVGGTGVIGLRLTDRLPYFVSGVAYPDWTVFSPAVLRDGIGGVIGAGFFGNDWRVESGSQAGRFSAP